MIKLIDYYLNIITIYRLVLYFLILLVCVATVLSFFKILPFSPINIIFSATLFTVICVATNIFFARLFAAPANLESVYITALILTLIVTPAGSLPDLLPTSMAAIFSIASKYILAVDKKHLFNPAAFGAVAVGASWWVGTAWMTPFVVMGGLLVVRKVRRFSMVLSFLGISITILIFSVLNTGNIIAIVQRVLLETPLLFFAFIMLTEPQTTPPTKLLQIIYGILVALLFSLPVRFGAFYLTPELALLLGNVFSYLISPKGKMVLQLKRKEEIAPGIYDFIFAGRKKFNFSAGQYLEWTLGHKDPDNRGMRRYFTIASSPTEEDLRIGIKFYQNSSSYKKALVALKKSDQIVAGQLAGDFTLPKDSGKKMVFLAGGIGVTPYRSMVKYLLDKEEKRDITLFYSSKLAQEFVYKEIFDQAVKQLGMKVVYILTDSKNIPKGWKGRVGYIDAAMIKKEVPDCKDRIFYISGPHSMVDAFQSSLKEIGIPANQIKVDFFPGYA